jgi:hypothetical protein
MVEQHSSWVVSEDYTEEGDHAAPWTTATEELHRASTFWVATVHPTGRPHVVPVLAVMSGGALHVAAGPETQKARNLAHDPRVTITTSGDDFDVVVEGVVDTAQRSSGASSRMLKLPVSTSPSGKRTSNRAA